MLRTVIFSFVLVASAAVPAPAWAEDVFHALQRNSWFMQTTDRTAEIYVTSLGRGPKIVVLHGGFGANFEYMVGAVEPHLANHQFILFDQRGSLLSPYRGQMTELTVDDLVDDLELLRVQLGEERLTLLGHSMGTRLAMEYARRYPARVAKLILVGSLPPRVASAGEHDALVSESGQRAQAMTGRPEVNAITSSPDLDLGEPIGEAANPTPEQRRELDNRILTRLAVTPGGLARLTHRWRSRFAASNMVRVERWREMQGGRVYYNGEIGQQLLDSAPRTWDLAESLAGRRVPISVIQGDQDYIDPAASAWRASGPQEAFGTCLSVQVIGRAGHTIWFDDPNAFRDVLDNALGRSAC